MLGFQVADEVAGTLGAAATIALERRAARMVEAAGLGDRLDDEPEVGLRLCGDAEICALNRRYRGRDRATDVLAFAIREAPGAIGAPHVLGDVIVSIETADRQRRASLADELGFLFAHGLCHLLGYDHGCDRDEAEMNARIACLLAEAGQTGPVRPA